MVIDEKIINIFLHFGYLPNNIYPLPDSLTNWIFEEPYRYEFERVDTEYLVKMGSSALYNSIKEELKDDYNKTHIIPLSGGLDSRAILANLLEQLDSHKIIAVTYGLPDSPDVKTAKHIAKSLDIQWDWINLSEYEWKWNTELLIDAAKHSERPTSVFDTAINHSIQRRYGDDCIYWSGFMGESLSCLLSFETNIKNWTVAKRVFAEKRCRCKVYNLVNDHSIINNCLPIDPITDIKRLDYYTQLDLCIDNHCCVKHLYSPIGYAIRYPFINNHWVKFILSVPKSYRRRQFIYRKILQNNWPSIFTRWNSIVRMESSLLERIIINYQNNMLKKKSKIYLGRIFSKNLAQNILRTDVNYIDWDYAIRNQNDFKDVILSNMKDLHSRNILEWIDFDEIIKLHQSGCMNLSKEIMTLVSLEIHLKSNTLV